MGAWSTAIAQGWLVAIDEQWRKLQLAAMGPTLTPTAPPDVLLFVANEWTSYRAWRSTPASSSPAFRNELGEWGRRANVVHDELAAAGVTAGLPGALPLNARAPLITGPYSSPDQVVREAVETAKRGADRAADIAESYGRGLGQGMGFGGVVLVGAALWYFLKD